MLRFCTLFAIIALIAVASPASGAAPLNARERNARAALVVQSNSFEAAKDRILDDEIVALTRERDTLRKQRDQARVNVAAARANAQEERKRAEAAENKIGEIEEKMADLLAAKDAQFARERAILLSIGDKLVTTAEGLAVLEEYNKGGKSSYLEARKLLDALLVKRDEARKMQALAAQVSDMQMSAELDYDAMGKGNQTAQYVLREYEAIVRLAPNSAPDWVRLTELYRNTNQLDQAIDASQRAIESETTDMGKARALMALGDAHMLRIENVSGTLNMSKGIENMIALIAEFPELTKGPSGLQALEQRGLEKVGEGAKRAVNSMADVTAAFSITPQLLDARSSYMEAASLLNKQADDKALRLLTSEVELRLFTTTEMLDRAESAAYVGAALREFGTAIEEGVRLFTARSQMAPEKFEAERQKFAAHFEVIGKKIGQGPPTRSYFWEAQDQINAASNRLWQLWREDKTDIPTVRALVRYFDVAARSRPDRAYIYSGDAVRMMQQLADAQPEISIIRFELAKAHLLAGFAAVNFEKTLSTKNRSDAAAHYDMALEILASILDADPTSAQFHRGKAELLEARAILNGNEAAWDALIDHYENMRALGLLAPIDEQALKMALLGRKFQPVVSQNGATQ
jgi:hypothetical protein